MTNQNQVFIELVRFVILTSNKIMNDLSLIRHLNNLTLVNKHLISIPSSI